jgi:hypothetical protein
MAHYDAGDGYPWEESSSNRPALSHRLSSISDMSSPGSNHSSHRDSVVSLPSPTAEDQCSHSYDEVDVSHVRLSSIEGSGISPSGAGSSNSQSRSSIGLPDVLRVGTPPLMTIPDTLRAGTPPVTSPRTYNPFSRNSGPSYQPIASAAGSAKKSGAIKSKRFSTKRKSSLLGPRQGSIPEDEEIDMSLLASAMPMGLSNHKTAYSTVQEEEGEDESILSSMGHTGSFDISSFTGPMSPESEARLREINRQEAAGILTGGLGAGWKPDTTIRSTDLFASAPQTPQTSQTPTRGLSRRMSRRISFRSPGLARAQTLRDLGQMEANKRGEIVQVIVEGPEGNEDHDGHEEEPPVDLTSMSGGTANRNSAADFDQIDSTKKSRKNTLPVPAVEVFYPQANWKPFSMRWPYLTGLIVISVALAASQEYLLQKSQREPLYQFKSAESLKTWDYFCFKYLPTLIAVSFGVLWQITDFEVKRLEAYYQLSREGGALAAESINVDYITFFNFLRPIRALKYKHYAVAVSSLATLVAVSLVPTLQSASIKLFPDRLERERQQTGIKEIRIDPILSRFLSSFLVIIAVLGCILVWQLQRRPSGLVADVKGIAGIAAMANRSHILMDFKNMDTATPEMIHQTLKAHRYTLRNSSLAPEDKVPLTQEEKDKYDQQTRHENPHPLMLRLVAGIPFIIGTLLFMVLIPIILFQPTANIVTEKAPWLLTVLAVCIKLSWGTLETDVRMIEPFYILSRRHASPRVLTLDYTAMAFGWMPIRAFLNGHFLVGLVGLGSVLAEILTICSTSFANVSGTDFATAQSPPPGAPPHNRRDGGDGKGVDAGEETFLSFWISFGLAMAILGFLCLVATFVYWRRRHPFLPRQPNTIASILAFIHQSKMLYDFVGTEKMNNDEMVKRLVGIGKTYGLGWFTGRDGEMHCGVDEEELVSNYRHGDDARKANMPWVTNWENY